MAQYIDKDTLVAEIEKRILEIEEIGTYLSPKGILTNLLCHIDTFEVKEVDLDEEFDKYTADNFWALEGNNESPYLVEKDDMLKVAKHFFELGLKCKNE